MTNEVDVDPGFPEEDAAHILPQERLLNNAIRTVESQCQMCGADREVYVFDERTVSICVSEGCKTFYLAPANATATPEITQVRVEHAARDWLTSTPP